MTIDKKLVSETVMPLYFVREELWTHVGDPDDYDPENQTEMTSAYSFAGDYIGNVEDAEKLVEFGIAHFEKTKPEHSVCSIGFNPATGKWFGWSHRAIYGYGVGDVVEAGTVPVSDVENGGESHEGVLPGMKVETLDDAKRVATAFARSVS